MENPFLFNCVGTTEEGFYVHMYFITDKEGVPRKRISFFTENNYVYQRSPSVDFRQGNMVFFKAVILEERNHFDTIIRYVKIIEETTSKKACNVQFLPLLEIDM
jgi:hypothetical protein